MEGKTIKRGRPRVFTVEERKENKSKYMLNKEWYCRMCNNNKNYTLAGKTCHIKTKKHHDAISKFLKDYVEKHSK